MGEIAVHKFITLGGVIEEPSWTMDYPFDPKMGEAIGAIMGSSKALLLGRRTFEMFAPAWSERTAEDDRGAPFMNDSPKYVVSATLESAEWNNSTILGPYQADAIRELKKTPSGTARDAHCQWPSHPGRVQRRGLRNGRGDTGRDSPPDAPRDRIGLARGIPPGHRRDGGNDAQRPGASSRWGSLR